MECMSIVHGEANHGFDVVSAQMSSVKRKKRFFELLADGRTWPSQRASDMSFNFFRFWGWGHLDSRASGQEGASG